MVQKMWTGWWFCLLWEYIYRTIFIYFLVLILGYCFIVENFAILPREEHGKTVTSSSGVELRA
jgi:hypothetical protein